MFPSTFFTCSIFVANPTCESAMSPNIFSLYTKLCDVPTFTQEVQRHIEHLEGDLKKIGNILQQSPTQGQSHFKKKSINTR